MRSLYCKVWTIACVRTFVVEKHVTNFFVAKQVTLGVIVNCVFSKFFKSFQELC